MRTHVVILAGLLFTAGCATEKTSPFVKSFDDPMPFSAGYFDSGESRGKESSTATFYVQQGRVFRYRVAAKGTAVRITIHGGMPGKKKLIDQKEGLDFESSFVPEFTGLVEYRIEVVSAGVATGEVIPLTKVKETSGS